MKTKQKILLFVQWFVPGYKAGGPINSCRNFVLAMENDFEIFVLTTDRDLGDKEGYPNIEANQWMDFGKFSKVCYLLEEEIDKPFLLQKIAELKPDFLYLNSLYSPVFSIPILTMALRKKLKNDIVLTPRGELNKAAIAIKWYKKIPYLFLLRLFGLSQRVKWQATNLEEEGSIKKIFGQNSQVDVLSNFPKQSKIAFKPISKKKGSVNFISISRIAKIKNIGFFLSVLSRVKGEAIFDVYGPKEDGGYYDKLQELSKKLPPTIKFNFKGLITPNLIEETLQQYHFFISPTLGENFGHAIFEAILAGRPLIISDRTPWLDLQQGGIGWDLSLENLPAWVDATQQSVDMDDKQFQKMSQKTCDFGFKYIDSSNLVEQTKTLFTVS